MIRRLIGLALGIVALVFLGVGIASAGVYTHTNTPSTSSARTPAT